MIRRSASDGSAATLTAVERDLIRLAMDVSARLLPF
jgi:hypothetical protein